jgi:hypothetical protein
MRETLASTMAVTLLPLAGCMAGPNYKTRAVIYGVVNHLLQLSMWHQLCLRVMKRKF